jgi:hypothetical protein
VLRLLGTGFYLPPALSIALSGGILSFKWPAANSAGCTLYSTTNLGAAEAWTITAGAVTIGDQVFVTQGREILPSRKTLTPIPCLQSYA